MTSILNNNNNNNIAVESLSPVNWDAHKFLADLGRKISRVSGVWRRQVNHVFVLTHFCFVISFQFCFVAQQLRVGRPLRTLASPFFLNFLNIFPTLVFRGFKKTKKLKIITIIIIIIVSHILVTQLQCGLCPRQSTLMIMCQRCVLCLY